MSGYSPGPLSVCWLAVDRQLSAAVRRGARPFHPTLARRSSIPRPRSGASRGCSGADRRRPRWRTSISAAIGVWAFSGKLSSADANEQSAGEDGGRDREGVDARVEHAEPARLPDPLLARMPFMDVLVPDDPHLGDALAGQRLGRGSDGGIVTGVPGCEQGRALALRRGRPDRRPRSRWRSAAFRAGSAGPRSMHSRAIS